MKLGAWIHDYSDEDLEKQIAAAAESGMASIRSYWLQYSQKVAPLVKASGIELLAGITVDGPELAADWKSQVKLDEIEATANLDCVLCGLCVGNELREGGDEPGKKRFTARLSFGLARVLEVYREWMAKNGASIPLTYAMEGIVFDANGQFKEHLWPLIDACDIVSLNLYPLTSAQWFTYDAFEESRKFLHDDRVWRRRMSEYDARLRMTLEVLENAGKKVFLTEMGFPSGVGYKIDGEINGKDHVWPIHDNEAFAGRMTEYIELLASASRDYNDIIGVAYFYEWWDNHRHQKIWNIEQSPIHTCFGLCDDTGKPKLDIQSLANISAK